MHIEFRHLRAIKAIHETGGVGRAAEVLGLTQSALSHQIKGLEDQTGVALFARRVKPLRLSAAGLRMLAAAETILPQLAALEAEFAGLEAGHGGRLHIAIECHACFEWLLPVLEQFRQVWPDIDVDIRPGLAFDALPALRREEVDLVVSSDPENMPGVHFAPLFDYAPVFVCASDHPLAARAHIDAVDFRGEALITYPVDRTRLDVFSQLLTKAKVEPGSIRQVELTAMILMLVSAGRGVAVLPDWVVRQDGAAQGYVVKPLTQAGLTRRLFAATRQEDRTRPYIAQLVKLAGAEAVKLQRLRA